MGTSEKRKAKRETGTSIEAKLDEKQEEKRAEKLEEKLEEKLVRSIHEEKQRIRVEKKSVEGKFLRRRGATERRPVVREY